ncbi:MAG: PAS domain-containing sensor histidine kinase [Proteobacteria bacterium]|nr:PAS domain-containing sensor histidine kinase [Pseudomonadota bacterium]
MSNDGTLGLDGDGMIIRFGSALERMLGYSEQEVLGTHVESLFFDTGLARDILSSAEPSDGLVAKPVNFAHKSGSVVESYLSVFPLRDGSKKVYSYILNISMERSTDVPGILSTEFQRIFSFSQDGVAVTDCDGKIIDVNDAFLKLYGYERHEVLGQNPRVLKSSHSTPALYEEMWGDIFDEKKGYWVGEIINLRKDEREVPVLLSINAIKNEEGEIKNFLGIAYDMTRNKELERFKRIYMDYIVHDMRSPLTSIIANSELLIMLLGERLDQKEREKLTTIITSANRLNGMTNDILEYSRSDDGELKLDKRELAPAELINEVVVPFTGLSKRITVNGVEYGVGTEVAGAGATIFADPEKFRRMLHNTVAHAYKYAIANVQIVWSIEGGTFRFTVSDDGEGVSKEVAERIFNDFFQTDEGIKTGGAGLGLCILKSFTEAHGGRVWVNPCESGGATIGFECPV